MARNRRNKRKFNMAGAPKLTEAQKTAKRLEKSAANIQVAVRREMFRQFRGDGAIGHEMTCAGRLMIVGCFDGMDADPETVLAALLNYQSAYWGSWGGGPQVASHGKIKVDGSPPEIVGEEDEDGVLIDPQGLWFRDLDQLLKDAGHDARRAVHSVTVDQHWFPDENADWADRIINQRLVQKRAELAERGEDVSYFRIVGECRPCDSDWALRDLLRQGAASLMGLREKRMAA